MKVTRGKAHNCEWWVETLQKPSSPVMLSTEAKIPIHPGGLGCGASHDRSAWRLNRSLMILCLAKKYSIAFKCSPEDSENYKAFRKTATDAHHWHFDAQVTRVLCHLKVCLGDQLLPVSDACRGAALWTQIPVNVVDI